MTHPLMPFADSSISTDVMPPQQALDRAINPRLWRVGVIGLGPQGLFQLERLSLSSHIRATGAYDADPCRRKLAEGLDCFVTDEPPQVTGGTDAIFFTSLPDESSAKALLRAGQHLVIDCPWKLTAEELLSIQREALESHRFATFFCPRRWSAEFLLPNAAIQSNRLGQLISVEYTSCVKQLSGEPCDADDFLHWQFELCDQLLSLVDSRPTSVFANVRFDTQETQERCFVAFVEFENGCTAQLKVDFRSRLTFRTGWMLEGTVGSYRNGRLYTETDDGEITDEPILRPAYGEDPFLQALVSAWQGESTSLPSLGDAASTINLMTAINRSSRSGQAVRV